MRKKEETGLNKKETKYQLNLPQKSINLKLNKRIKHGHIILYGTLQHSLSTDLFGQKHTI